MTTALHPVNAPQPCCLSLQLIASGFPAGFAIDDDAAMRFAGTTVAEVVSARDGATAYRVERVDGVVVETPLVARRLPGSVRAAGAD